jgi:hypothetical protein
VIHYHGGPITPVDVALTIWKSRHALISFAYPDQLPTAAEVASSFVLDNGAFTVWKQGGKLDVKGYATWCNEWQRHPGFDWCLIPDSIEGGEDENDGMLADWPLDGAISVPVWHMHESLERLERLIASYSRVAIGSSGEYVEIGTLRWWSRQAEAMSVACDSEGRPRTKLHGLRQQDPTITSHIPYASDDSTNAAQNHGLDTRWKGPYQPLTQRVRGLVLVDRIEGHATAARWNGSCGVQKNLELVG